MTKAANFVKAHGKKTQSNDYPAFLSQLLAANGADSSAKQDDGSVKHTFDDGSTAKTQPDDDMSAIIAMLDGDGPDAGDPDGDDDSQDDSDPAPARA